MTSCVLSATMGNYEQLRKIHLFNKRVRTARQLWTKDRLDRLGFLPRRTWSSDQLISNDDGYLVKITTGGRPKRRET